MESKRTGTVYVLLCLLLCLVLSAGMLLGSGDAKANERRAALPGLKNGAALNPEYLSELADYVSDHFFLRQELITARSRILSALGSSGASDVLCGAEGWLYYAPTLTDYTGGAPASDDDLARMARNLCLMQEYCEGQGMTFLFTIAPNKNSLYPGAMPRRFPAAAEHDAQRLMRELDALGVRYADLFSVFGAQDETLYFAHDSHWNAKGAALGADAINAAFGRTSDYFSDPFNGEAAPHSGDLFAMLYPAAADPETDPAYTAALDYRRQGSETRPDSITINTEGGGTGTLTAFRDSFGNSLYPYLADSFARARFSRANAYNLAMAAGMDADCVLVELVERNLGYLLEYVPVMPAPTRTAEEPGAPAGSLALTGETQSGLKDHTLWQGTLPEGGADGPVLLRCADTVYEAFARAEGGFAAYLPAGEMPETVSYQVDGSRCSRTLDVSLR